VWLKANPTPQMRGKRLCNAHETLIWAKKSEKQAKYTFHYHSLKAGNEDKQMRSDWYFPICSGQERLQQNGRKAHATQKPEALVRRIVQATSNSGDIVLDPFCGTGTTAAVAKSLGRRFITIDKEEAYVGLAEKRLASISTLPFEQPLDVLPSHKARIPFVTLVETGLLTPGQTLRLKGKPIRAVIHADGTLSVDDKRGSIHRVGALCLNVPSCNGWTSWLYTDPTGEECLLDSLRQALVGA
jgi:modification methylase